MNAQDKALSEALNSVLPASTAWKLGAICQKAVDVDEDERSVVATVTTEDVDRDREVILTRGLKTTSFRKNPVVLFMHDMTKVIGKSLWEKKTEKGGKPKMIAKARFADTPLAEEVFQLVKGGFLKACSIGMNPFSMVRRMPKPGEIKARPELADRVAVIESAEMVEFSFVSVPANANALTGAKAAGLIRETLPVMEPLLRAVQDAGSRKNRVVKVISSPARRRVVQEDEELAIIDPVKTKRIAEAVRAGRI